MLIIDISEMNISIEEKRRRTYGEKDRGEER
jgi:hypothetical protein